jgi:mercuric ion transport protein
MIDDTRTAAPERTRTRDTGALLLAAGGLAAAFGAASCCALPLLLGSLGLGTAWLVTVAWFAAPHRLALLAIAIICLGSGCAVLLRRRRRMAACAPSAACGSPIATALVTCVLSLGAVLVVLGFMFAWVMQVILKSTITCPHCGTGKAEIMPTDACQFFYECTGCGALLRLKPGDCCVFCSYGSVPCPPVQQQQRCCIK